MAASSATRVENDPVPGSIKPSASKTPIATDPRAEEHRLSIDDSRPELSRTWQTDRPQPTSKHSMFPARLARIGTQISALNTAVRSNYDDDGDSSSSTSSDDEHEVPAPKKHGKGWTQGPKAKKGQYSKFDVGNDDFNTRGRVSKRDGRLNISVNETNNTGYLAKALGANVLMKHLETEDSNLAATSTQIDEQNRPFSRASEITITSDLPRPKLRIVVMVIGSRGDIQPFLKLGKTLQDEGHRVRIATHPAFKEFVQKDSGLEFFSVGGDPAELMAFMVKNPGMIPRLDTLKKGEVGRRRGQMAEMFEGFWRACINATDDEKDSSNVKMMEKKAPFVADAIIANPPSFAHIHCAERLGIPLHLMFTFPYTPTQAFPHPLANINKTNVDAGYANFMSYPLVEMMTWQGLGDLINNFRVKTLGLEPVSTLWAPGQVYRLKVPYTYLWSPGLIPKPADWGTEIDIAGFVFLDLASSFKPPEALTKFLDAGPPPVYIGFGSIVVDDPDKFTTMIFEAVEKAGVRALVSKGWGGLGDDDNTPDNVFMLENTPHDWLFPRVSAVVHHGGAGTTAIGLKCGKPTMVVPFFGDQPFWGSMIWEAGAGAEPVPYKELSADKLADGIKQCLSDGTKEEAMKLAKNIEAEGDGAKNAVASFHRSLVLRGERSMRCSILEDRVAVWSLKNSNLRLSALAAQLLVETNKVHWKQLRLIRHNEWNDFGGPGEPLTGGATAIVGTVTGIASGVGSVPFRLRKTAQKRSRWERRQQRKREKAQAKRKVHKEMSTNGNITPANDDPVQENDTADNVDEDKLSDAEDVQKGSTEQVAAEHSSSFTPGGEIPGSAGFGKHTPSGAPIPRHPHTSRNSQEDYFDKESIVTAPEANVAEDYAKDVGAGLGRTGEAVARMPLDLSLAVAQGFHNAPRLYGDTSVRKPTRITGMKSGLKAAGEEFAFGVYDGFTGVVKQPYQGARDGGAVGAAKGVGMGTTGFFLKNLAAIFGPFAYTLKGVHKELLKSKQPTHFIRKAKMFQGKQDLKALKPAQQKEALEQVAHGWDIVQEIGMIMTEEKGDGIRGRVKLFRERKTWKDNGAFENIEMAERALEARKKGESLEAVFEKQREGLKYSDSSQKNQSKDSQDEDERVKDFGHIAPRNGSVKPVAV